MLPWLKFENIVPVIRASLKFAKSRDFHKKRLRSGIVDDLSFTYQAIHKPQNVIQDISVSMKSHGKSLK